MVWKMLTRIVRTAVFLGGVVFFTVTVARSDNLADALVGAYKSSGILEQNRALLRAADEDAAITLSALRPILEFGTSLSRVLNDPTPHVTSRNVNLTATWLLWDKDRSNLSTQAAKETVLATRAALLSLEQQVLFRAINAYMDVIRSREFVSLRENNVRLLQEELRAAENRFDVGAITRTDVALAEARLAQARSNLATAEGNSVNSRQEYLAAVGRAPDTLLTPPTLPERPSSVDNGKAVAVRNHPDILRAQHQLAAAELRVKAARADLGPQVSLRGQLSSDHSSRNLFERDSALVSLNFAQPLYQGGALSSRLRKAMVLRDSARTHLLVVQENLQQNVATAMVRFDVAMANIEALKQQIQAAEVAFQGVREEASLGARTTLDVLDAEQELLDARANLIAAQSELSVAAYQIVASQGNLTVANLGLSTQIYDPKAYYDLVKEAPALLSEQGRQLDRILQRLDQ